MSAAWLWARRELRRRWRSVVVLALLTAITGGVAMTAITGARRSLVAVAETMDERRQPDVISLPNLPGFDWRPIVELPYVDSWGLLAATGLCIEETGGLGERIGGQPGALCDQPPVEGGIYRSIARMDILEGRMPTGPRDVAVNRLAQRRLRIDVGDRLHVEGVRPGRLEEYWHGKLRGRRPWGPTFTVRVTGVFTGSDDFWRLISGGRGHPGVALSRSFIPTFGKSIAYRRQALLRLREGERDIPRLVRDVARITGDSAFPIRNVREAQRRVERSTRVEASALLLFAVALLAAASVLLGQALTRLIRAGAPDAPTLRSLGMAPRQVVAVLASPGLAVGAAGAAGAVVASLATSPRVPIGVARTFELDGGMKVDVPVLALGTLGILVVCALASLAAALPIVRRRYGVARASRGPTFASFGRLPLPAPVALGARLALGRGLGVHPMPVRPALVGAAVAVLAVAAAIVVHQGIVASVDHPERAGQSWDVAYQTGSGDRAVAREPAIAAAAEVRRGVVSVGGFPAPAYAVRPIGRPLDQVVLEGRAPRRAGEVALGPSTASALGVEVGDRLRAGPGGTRPVHVVGTALLWEEGGHAAYDEGVWTTPAGLQRLDPAQVDWEHYFVDVRPGADLARLDRRMAAAGGPRERVWPAGAPAAIDSLETTRKLPVLLAGLLALLGAGTVGHGLVSTVRRRRRDLAVLRALGLSGAQTRAVLAWQATTVAIVGLLVGLPLGIAAGHYTWRLISNSLPIVYVAPSAALAAWAIVPAALLAVNAVALWPARAAARTRPAAVLRAE